MPARIHTYLDAMDDLRDEANMNIDSYLSKIKIKVLINNPKERKKLIMSLVLDYLKQNKKLIAQASLEGKKLARSL